MHEPFLRYLDEVARQGSIRKAASLLNVSSTSVNRNIINTEQKLGVRLLDRTPEGVELTAAGKIVLEHCRKTLYDFVTMQSMIDDIRDLRTGHLSIHTIDSITFGVLPRILDQFSDGYPGISLSVNVAVPDEIAPAVVSGDADIGITFTKVLHPGVRVFSEKSAPFGIIICSDHPLAERIRVSVDDLKDYALVRTTDARGRNSIIDQELDAAARALRTHFFTNSLAVAKRAILSKKVIGIYTKIGFLKEIEAGELKFVPLSVHTLGDYKVGLIISASSGISPALRLFFNIADKVFKNLNLES
jgi:DNA-binding transcriptional LysR family regulator